MKYAFYLVTAVFLISCAKEEELPGPAFGPQSEADIIAYIDENNIDATRTESGLYVIIHEPGTGDQPTATDDVTVVYKGYFLNGSVFDPGRSTGSTFNLQQVIKGWTEGMQLFKEGGKGTLIIPSELGYGPDHLRDPYTKQVIIPGGAVLVFDIELLMVN